MIDKVWVLGADSFTGKYLVPELMSQGFSVDTTTVDITVPKEVTQAMQSIQPDYIINLAAISFVPDSSSESIYAVNTLGPDNILNAAEKLTYTPKKIILVSSANIYGNQRQGNVLEESKPDPVNHYGCSKWSMEQIAKTYSESLNITIARPFNYTGVGQDEKFLVPKIVAKFKNKADTIRLGNLNVWRDFSDVRWVAQAYSQLILSPSTTFSIVNVSSGIAVSIREIVDALQVLTGHKPKIESDLSFVRKTDIQRQCGNNEKLFELCPSLNKPTLISETLDWMLSN